MRSQKPVHALRINPVSTASATVQATQMSPTFRGLHWVYICNSYLNWVVALGISNYFIYTNDSIWILGPYDGRDSLFPNEEGLNLNYSYMWVEELPICIRHEIHRLKVRSRVWLSSICNGTNLKGRRICSLSQLRLWKEILLMSLSFRLIFPLATLLLSVSELSEWEWCRGPEVGVLTNTS